MRVGVLALQGDFREHLFALEECGVTASIIRRPSELANIDALVLPGGESTAIANLARSFELFDPLKSRIAGGMPDLVWFGPHRCCRQSSQNSIQ